MSPLYIFFWVSLSHFSSMLFGILWSVFPPSSDGFHWVDRCERMFSTLRGIRSLYMPFSHRYTSSRAMLFAMRWFWANFDILYFIKPLDGNSFGNLIVHVRSPWHRRLIFWFLHLFQWLFIFISRVVSEDSRLILSTCWVIGWARLSSPLRR